MPETPWRIVQASAADLERLHALTARALIFDTFSASLLDEKLFLNPHPDRDEYHTLMAERDGEAVGMLQHVIRADEKLAWLGLFGVAEAHRRQGVGRRLFESARSSWRARGVRTVDVLTIPTNYLVPGLDPRYTPAVCFVESLGFVQRAKKANLRAVLDRDFETRARETTLRADGIEVRRARVEDKELIERFFAADFGDGWLAEVRRAMKLDPPGVHLALRDSVIVGFSAHSTMNREWGNFGPMGTVESARGKGIGQVLLYRCLRDLKTAGFTSAVIPWIGPHRFYCNLLNCAIERVFWQYRLELTSQKGDAAAL